MLDANQTSPRPPSRNAAVALPVRAFAPKDARIRSLRAVGRQLRRAIRSPVIACLRWRLAAYRARNCIDSRELMK